jgi:hypothetical protein
LRADQTVYIQTAEIADENGVAIKGKVTELSGSTLRLLVNGQRREYSERDVLVVSERHTSTAKGALIGVAIGGGLGLLGMTTCGKSTDPETCGWAQFGLIFGVGVGAGLGATLGHSIQHEQILFLAPDLGPSRTFTIAPSITRSRQGVVATLRF